MRSVAATARGGARRGGEVTSEARKQEGGSRKADLRLTRDVGRTRRFGEAAKLVPLRPGFAVFVRRAGGRADGLLARRSSLASVYVLDCMIDLLVSWVAALIFDFDF